MDKPENIGLARVKEARLYMYHINLTEYFNVILLNFR